MTTEVMVPETVRAALWARAQVRAPVPQDHYRAVTEPKKRPGTFWKEVSLPMTRRSTRKDLSWSFSLERKESVEKLHFQIPIDLLELNQLQDYKCLSTQDHFKKDQNQ